MNTLKVESLLARKYKYKPLPQDLSKKYREWFTENIPDGLCTGRSNDPIYTTKGSLISNGYNRIVVGDYGAFIEFHEPGCEFCVKMGQEYRIDDERYARNVKYIWLTIDDGSDIKIYFQKKSVSYADYMPSMYYVSVHEVVKELVCTT